MSLCLTLLSVIPGGKGVSGGCFYDFGKDLTETGNDGVRDEEQDTTKVGERGCLQIMVSALKPHDHQGVPQTCFFRLLYDDHQISIVCNHATTICLCSLSPPQVVISPDFQGTHPGFVAPWGL